MARAFTHAAQVTVFDSVGFALEDYAALCFLREAAEALGLGEVIELIAHTPDPKNLFGLLRAPRACRDENPRHEHCHA